jgi:hypothetical protein
MKLAIHRATKVPAQEIAEVMAPITSSFKAMREGVATEDEWAVLAGTVELGLAIERQGVVKGLQGHLQAAEQSLAAIQRRAMASGAWKPTALYYQEIEALDTFTWLHKTQLENLSGGEWRQAHDRAVAMVLSARGRVVNITELANGQQQLTLIGACA